MTNDEERDPGITRLRVQAAYLKADWDEAEQRRFHEIAGLGPVPLGELDDDQVAKVFDRMRASHMIIPKAAARAK